MSDFHLQLNVTPMVAEKIPMPHVNAIAQNVFRAIKSDHTEETMGETLRLVIPAEGKTGIYHAYLVGPVPFPVGVMLISSAEGAFHMLVGSREEIEERVQAAGNEPDITITKLT